jgi:hypothetical protein
METNANRRQTANDAQAGPVAKTLAERSAEYDIPESLILDRVRIGWD